MLSLDEEAWVEAELGESSGRSFQLSFHFRTFAAAGTLLSLNLQSDLGQLVVLSP